MVSSHHFMSIFESEEVQYWCRSNPIVVLKWIEAMFFYFRSMSAIPEVAEAIWSPSARIVELLKLHEKEALLARVQLASWGHFYSQRDIKKYLDFIKDFQFVDPSAIAFRSLFLSSTINRDHADFLEHIKYSYEKKIYFSHENLSIAIINYYCHIESEEHILKELTCHLTSDEMKGIVETGNCDFIKPLLWHLYEHGKYNAMLRFVRAIKGDANSKPMDKSHGFILSNGSNLVAISPSGKDIFLDSDNENTYKELIKASNTSVNTFISLLGDRAGDISYFDESRPGAPSGLDDLSNLANATIKHFKLTDPIYSELHSITLVPSHNFPIQSALFKLGKNAPIISVKLEDITDEPKEKRFIFFLSSNTFTYLLEKKFILNEFGDDAVIVIDPSPDVVAEKTSSGLYNVIYISAHGEYDHWSDGESDEIFFSENSRISVPHLRSLNLPTGGKVNIILNICDGATTNISCNPYCRGIASRLASGNKTVISHLWPVTPLYAYAFGVLAIYFMKNKSAIQVAKCVFDFLNHEDQIVNENLSKLSPSFSSVQESLQGKNLNFSSFKNIGSIAVYS